MILSNPTGRTVSVSPRIDVVPLEGYHLCASPVGGCVARDGGWPLRAT